MPLTELRMPVVDLAQTEAFGQSSCAVVDGLIPARRSATPRKLPRFSLLRVRAEKKPSTAFIPRG